MATGALFGNATGTRSQSKNLVEFRAGKMRMEGKMVHPDKRKGLVYVYQSEGDSLMHFCWKDRSKSKPEEDLIIFPDDVEFKRVSQCTTGRVFLLKFQSSSRRMFFWMQEPKSDKDEDFCKKVNDFLNNPPAPGSSRAGGSGGGGLGSLPAELAGLGGEGDLQNILGNMSQQQLMQLLGGMGMGNLGGLPSLFGGGGGRPSSSQSESQPPSRVQSSPGPRVTSAADTPSSQQRPVTAAALPSQGGATTATTATTPAPEATSPDTAANIQLRDLQNILSGMGGAGGAAAEQKEPIDLAAAVTPEVMIPILANAEVQERLVPFLPEGESLPKTEGELKNTVQSPQFQQAMQSFSAALASGQLGPLMNQFNLGDDVVTAAAAGDVEAFAKAMQSAVGKKEEADKEKEKEEPMDTKDDAAKETKEEEKEEKKKEEEK